MDMITYDSCIRRAETLLGNALYRQVDEQQALTYQASVWIELAKTVKEYGGVR